MSLVTGIQDLATGIGNYLRDNVMQLLLPPGGTDGQVLTKTSITDGDAAWESLGTAATKNIHVGTTAPTSPAEGDIWIDTN